MPRQTFLFFHQICSHKRESKYQFEKKIMDHENLPEAQDIAQKAKRIYLSEIFTRLCLVLKKDPAEAFSIMKISYETSLTNREISAFVIKEILKHIVNRRKKILFRQLENINQAAGYWQAKGTTLFIQLLQKKTNISLALGFSCLCNRRLEKRAAQTELQKISLKRLHSILNNFYIRQKRKCFYKIMTFEAQKKAKKGGIFFEPDITKHKEVVFAEKLRPIIQRTFRQSLTKIQQFTSHQSTQSPIKSVLRNKQPILNDFQSENDSQNLMKIEAIKTIIVSLNKTIAKRKRDNSNNKKFSNLRLASNNYQQLAVIHEDSSELLRSTNNKNIITVVNGLEIMSNLFNKKQYHSLSHSFNRILWRFLGDFDQDMIDKLETQIDVLQHEFDSI